METNTNVHNMITEQVNRDAKITTRGSLYASCDILNFMSNKFIPN